MSLQSLSLTLISLPFYITSTLHFTIYGQFICCANTRSQIATKKSLCFYCHGSFLHLPRVVYCKQSTTIKTSEGYLLTHIHMCFVSNQDATLRPAGWLVILQEMTSSKISSRTPTEVVAYLSPSVLVSTWKHCYKDQFVPCESQGSLFSCLHTRVWDSEMIENEFSLEGFGWFHAVLPSLWKVYSQCTVTCRETELL